jgi:hypothetical protein
MRTLGLAGCLALLAACGPAWAPPNAPARPCDIVDAAAAAAAREAGAAFARARVSEGGMVSMETGPGVVHCATYTSAMKPCRRPNDFVIEYTPSEGEAFFVLVPANAEYRFRAQAVPNTCEIVLLPAPP